MATPLNNSLLKGFHILGLFSPSTPEISAAMVVDRLGLNAATAHRFLVTLEAAGALRTTRRGSFALGPKIEDLGRLAEDASALNTALDPVLQSLCHDLNQSVMVCRLTRHGPSCIAVARAARAISVHVDPGTLLPALNSAQGRIWLSEMSVAKRATHLKALRIAGQGDAPPNLDADLAAIRRQGFAVNLGDNEPDIAAVSVPIRDPSGQARWTLSAFGMLGHFDPPFVTRAAKHLRDTGAALGDLL